MGITFLAATGTPSGLRASDDPGGVVVTAASPDLHTCGRCTGLGTAAVTFGYSGALMGLRFNGTSVTLRMDDPSGQNYVMAWLDGQPGRKFRLDAKDGIYPVADGLTAGPHMVEIVRATECNFGPVVFRGFVLNPGGQQLPWPQGPQRRIEFVGDSITCGYGVEVNDPKLHFTPATENFCLGYTGLTVRALAADYVVVARSGIGMVRNYNGPYEGSDETIPVIYPETFYEQANPVWDFSRFSPDVVCINIGTNDFSTTGVDVKKFIDRYVAFGTGVLERYGRAQLVVIQGPMNNSKELGAALSEITRQLSVAAAGRVHFFALGAQGSVGFGADSHPNRAQSKISARELTADLRQLMGWN